MLIGFGLSLMAGLKSSASPAALFANGEVGVWYDPSDLTTLFQDSAGTTPVTAAGQPVGLMLDKSKGLTLGAELNVSGFVPWVSSGFTFTGGILSYTNGGGSTTYPQVTFFPSLTSSLRVTIIVTAVTGSVQVANQGGSQSVSLALGSNTFTLKCGSDQKLLFIFPVGSSVSMSAFSIKELAGNHATQATSAQRPTYGIHPYSGVRNFQVQTEDFSSTSWTKNACTVSIPSTPSPARGGVYGRITSTGTFSGLKSPFVFTPLTQYTVSGVVKKASGSNFTLVGDSLTPPPKVELNFDTGAFSVTNCTGTATLVGANEYFVTMTFTTPAVTTAGRMVWWVGVYSGVNTAGQAFDLSAPQIELGATVTAYQKVVTQYEVTEAGVPSVHYIGFDGVDDGMVTSAIDFSATDAVTVFAGVRKLSDAARAMLYELGPTTATASIRLEAPNTPAVGQYVTYSNGSLSGASANTNAASAPITSVVASVSKISTDTLLLRLNGTQVSSSATDQGTGNYAANQLYIGRRGGVALPFNGNIYSLIVRGTESTAGQITSTETWVNGKTGAY